MRRYSPVEGVHASDKKTNNAMKPITYLTIGIISAFCTHSSNAMTNNNFNLNNKFEHHNPLGSSDDTDGGGGPGSGGKWSFRSSGVWNQFGRSKDNGGRINQIGPIGGLTAMIQLVPSISGSIGSEVGVLNDKDGDNVVSSYDPYLHMFDNAGNHKGVWNFPVASGCRAVPYVDLAQPYIYTGAESGGLYEVHVDKTTSPYTMSTAVSDASVGTIETSPALAADRTLYVSEQWGDVHRYDIQPLSHKATYSLGEVITGAIALYDVTSAYPNEEVVVATKSGNVYVLSHDLSTLITSNTAGSSRGDQYYGGATVAKGSLSNPVVIVGVTTDSTGTSYTGNLRAIDLVTGSILWESIPSGTSVRDGSQQIEASVSLLNSAFFGNKDIAVAVSTDGNLYGFNTLTGAELWSYAMSDAGRGAPAVGRFNGVYVVDGQEHLHVVMGTTGSSVYTDTSMYIGSAGYVGKTIIGQGNNLAVGTGVSAYLLIP